MKNQIFDNIADVSSSKQDSNFKDQDQYEQQLMKNQTDFQILYKTIDELELKQEYQKCLILIEEYIISAQAYRSKLYGKIEQQNQLQTQNSSVVLEIPSQIEKNENNPIKVGVSQQKVYFEEISLDSYDLQHEFVEMFKRAAKICLNYLNMPLTSLKFLLTGQSELQVTFLFQYELFVVYIGLGDKSIYYSQRQNYYKKACEIAEAVDMKQEQEINFTLLLAIANAELQNLGDAKEQIEKIQKYSETEPLINLVAALIASMEQD